MENADIPENPPENGYKIIGKPYKDHTGVNVRWMDKWGEVHFSNYDKDTWENNQWKDLHDDKVAKMYAEHEKVREESSREMDMKVEKVEEKTSMQNTEVDLSEKVREKKEKLKSGNSSEGARVGHN